MKKRMVAMVLGLAMVVSSLAGCGSEGEKDTSGKQESSAVKESSTEKESSQAASETASSSEAEPEEIPVDYFAGTELTIAILKYGNDTMENRNDKVIMKRMEEDTGIHINWIEVEQAVSGERKKVMLAQSDQPDAYLGLIGTSELVTNASLFYDLTEDEDLLKTYAPSIVAQYGEMEEAGANMWDMLTLPDGTIRSLATNQAMSYNSQAIGLWWINQDWLDQLDMEIPTNAEEFREVLQAFKDNDLNGNGKADEIPLSFCNSYYADLFTVLLNAFGIGSSQSMYGAPYAMVVDGVVTPTVDNDNYRAALEYYHDLLEDGLLDVEGFSQSFEQQSSKIAENKIGCFVGHSLSTYSYTGDDYTYMVPFQGLEGVNVRMNGTVLQPSMQLAGFAPTADCSNIEALLHWWNYASSTLELRTIWRLGEEGYGWSITEDGMLCQGNHDAHVSKAGEGFNFNNYRNQENMGNNSWPLRTYADNAVDYVAEAANPNQDRRAAVTAMIEAGVYNNVSEDIVSRFVDPLKVEERSFMETDLFPYISNFMANAVMDGFTDAQWDEYLEGLKDYQYYEWIQWYQDYYDRVF